MAPFLLTEIIYDLIICSTNTLEKNESCPKWKENNKILLKFETSTLNSIEFVHKIKWKTLLLALA